MKYSIEEWLTLLAHWNKALVQYDSAVRERTRLLEKAKTWLGCHPEFGNMSAIAEMIEREIGRAVVKEREPKEPREELK